MKLTCVTATFNAVRSGNRERLTRCVQSVAQLKTPHEHLIYDGASTDGTLEMLRELERTMPGLKVVSEQDTGIYNALNKGVREAKGEWFYVLGCDDYISDPTLMDRLIAEEKDSTQMIVTTVIVESATRRTVKFDRLENLGRIFRGSVCCHQGEIMRTDLVRVLDGFDERYRIGADTDLFLRAHLRGAVSHYVFQPFATFTSGGTADSNEAEFKSEDALIVSRNLGLADEEFAFYQKTWTLPLRRSLRLLCHRDLAIRIGARKMVVFWMWHLWKRIRGIE